MTERPPFNADRGPFRPGSSSRPSATGTQQQPRNDRKYTSPSRDGMPPRGPRPGSSSSPYQQQQQQAPGRGGGRSSNRGGPPGGGGRGGGGGERRSYSSFPQQQQQQRGDGNRSFRSGPPFAADGGGGGSNLQQLKLVNPMRISRMVDSSSSDSDPRRRSDDPSSRGRGPRPVASAAGSAGTYTCFCSAVRLPLSRAISLTCNLRFFVSLFVSVLWNRRRYHHHSWDRRQGLWPQTKTSE